MIYQPLSAIARTLFLTALLFLIPVAMSIGPVGSLPAWADDEDDDDDGPRQVRRAAPLPDYAPDEILLINPSDAALARSRELGFNVYSTEIIQGSQLTIARLRLPPGLDAPSALEVLRREAPEQTSDLNHFYRLQQSVAASADPYACGSARCYAQKMIKWTAELAECGEGVSIGILDTGVDVSHPSLRGQQVTSVSFAPPLTRPSPTQHGTAVTALLAGAGDRGLTGLVPKARIFAADVFHTGERGQPTADAVSIARGLGWLRNQGVSVINISLAGSENRVVEQAVKDTLRAGVGIVAAAGNNGPTAAPLYPAAIPGVIAVTALDERSRPYRRAAQGTHISYAAPGVNIWTAQPRGRYGVATGTSYAAPFVTAVLALVKKDGGESLLAQDLGAAGPDPVFGAGLVQPPERCRLETSKIGQ